MMKFVAVALLVFAMHQEKKEIESKVVDYKHGDVELQGYLAWRKDLPAGKRPGVVLFHEWKGHGDYVRRRADQLAKLGYVAFAADMYGKGVFAKDHTEAGKLAGAFFNDRTMMRSRAMAAVDLFKKMESVDAAKVAAIGYCFGGTTSLELARSGADLAAVVSFHGKLQTPKAAEAGTIKAKILVCHGADDPYIPKAEVDGFHAEMKTSAADWQFVAYGGAVHSFTVAEAGTDPSGGAAYNEKADLRSWDLMAAFFKETLK